MPACNWKTIYDRWFLIGFKVEGARHVIAVNGLDEQMAHNRFRAISRKQIVSSDEIIREAVTLSDGARTRTGQWKGPGASAARAFSDLSNDREFLEQD